MRTEKEAAKRFRKAAWIAAALLPPLLGAACASMNPLSGTNSAFMSGLASWGAYSLGHSYAVAIRENKQDCFASLFDVDEIADRIYREGANDDTRKETEKQVRAVFAQERKDLGTSYPGMIVFRAGGNEMILPPVHRSFRSPLEKCPDMTPPAGDDLDPSGSTEGTLTVDFPEKGKRIEMEASLSKKKGFRVVSLPVMKDLPGGTAAGAPQPEEKQGGTEGSP